MGHRPFNPAIQPLTHTPGPVDVGVRIELRNEVIEDVNEVLYEGNLIGYPNPFRNKVRTFYQNPGGFVAQENYDGGLAVVNGHSYKMRKSDNTNLAILCSHNIREPFDQPIAYAQNVASLHCLGDSSGWTRGLMMASVMGYLMGERLATDL